MWLLGGDVVAKKSSNFAVRLTSQIFILIFRILKAFVAPSSKNRKSASEKNPIRTSPGNSGSFIWPELNAFDFEIVGESNYQTAIGKLAGDHGNHASDSLFRAKLVPEDNPYDNLAIRVDGEGAGTVGYMSRDDARSFRRRLAAKGIGNSITFCSAQVTGGGIAKNGKEFSYGVRLGIQPFE
jgi:hypothetical protein